MAQPASAGETRAEKTRRERRMKPGSLAANGIKLALDKGAIGNEFQVRWAREERVSQLMARDWDPITNADAKSDGNGLGTVPTTHGGIAEDGKPYGMVAMKKYKDWFEEDFSQRMAKIDAKDEEIRRGLESSPDKSKLGASYTPNGANIIDKA